MDSNNMENDPFERTGPYIECSLRKSSLKYSSHARIPRPTGTLCVSSLAAGAPGPRIHFSLPPMAARGDVSCRSPASCARDPSEAQPYAANKRGDPWHRLTRFYQPKNGPHLNCIVFSRKRRSPSAMVALYSGRRPTGLLFYLLLLLLLSVTLPTCLASSFFIPPSAYLPKGNNASSLGDLFREPEPLFDILTSTRWSGDYASVVSPSDMVDYNYGLTVPRLVPNTDAQFSGVVVDRFPKQACQTLVSELREANALDAPSSERLAVRAQYTGDDSSRLFSLIVNTRANVQARDQPRVNDMRVLLTKELRYLIRQKDLRWSKSLEEFLKKEEAARMQFAGKFLESMKMIKEDYELRVLVQGTEDSSAEVGIKKIFLVEVLNDFPNVLLQETFFSATLQLFFSTIFQYPRTRIVMDRGPMEAIFHKHMQTGDATGERVADRLFSHVVDTDKYFHPGAKALFIDVLKLAWKYYYEHSEKMLQLVHEDSVASAFFLAAITNLPYMVDGIDAPSMPLRKNEGEETAANQVQASSQTLRLDAFGFATVVNLAVWQGVNKLGDVAVLQSICRFVFVARSRSDSTDSLPHFQPAFLSARFTSTFQTPLGGIFSGVFFRTKKPFSPALHRRLKIWEGGAAPAEAIEIRHLTSSIGETLRQNALRSLGPSVAATEFYSVLSNGHGDEFLHAAKSTAGRLFDDIFVSSTSSLRSLFNMELFTLVDERTVRDGQPEFDEMKELRKEIWPRVGSERRRAIAVFGEKLKEIEDDPNTQVDSFFRTPHLLGTILKSHFFYTHSVLDSVYSIASIPELGNPKLAIRITLRGLAAAQRLLDEWPLTPLTPELAKQLKLYKSVGAQDGLRQSFLARLNAVVQLSILFYNRHSDSYADLIPSATLALIRGWLVRNLFPDGRRLVPSERLLADLDAHGFTTALALLTLSEELRAPVQYLDEQNRLFVLACGSCSGARMSFIRTSNGLVSVPAEALSLEPFRFPIIPPAHHFAGLKIWEAPRASVAAPKPPAPGRLRTALGRVRALFGKRRGTREPVSQRRLLHVNGSVIRNVLARSGLHAEPSECTPLADSFPTCLVESIVTCSREDEECRKRIESASSSFNDMLERLWLEISNPRFVVTQLRSETHWRLLTPILVDLVLVTEGKLTPEERELLFGDSEFLQSAEGRRATRLLWLRLLLDRPEPLTDRDFVPINEALERFGRGGPVPVETVRNLASYYTKEIAPRTRESNDPGIQDALTVAVNKARKELATLGMYDATERHRLKRVIADLYYARQDSLFDFLLGSLPAAKFPEAFRRTVKSCLLSAWREEVQFDRMMRELEQLNGLPTVTPKTIQTCFRDGADGLAAGAGTTHALAQLKALEHNTFFRFSAYHRLRVILEAHQLFSSLVQPQQSQLLSDGRLERIVDKLRLLTASRFQDIFRKAPAFSEFAFAFLAAHLNKDFYILDSPTRDGSAGHMLLLGTPATGFLRPRSIGHVTVLCVPDCHVLTTPFTLTKAVTLEAQTQARSRAISLRNMLLETLPKVKFLSTIDQGTLDSATRLLPVQARLFTPAEAAAICGQQDNSLADIFVVRETCSLTEVSKTFFFEALTLSLGIGNLSPFCWIRFWMFSNPVAVSLAKTVLQEHLSKSGRPRQANGLERLGKDQNWRRLMPTVYTRVLQQLQASLSGFREIAALVRRLNPTAGFVRRLLQGVVSFFRPSRSAEGAREERATTRKRFFTEEDVLSKEALESLPESFFAKNWPSFSLCMDSGGDGLDFAPAYRLAVAIGTGLIAAERFATESHMMYGPIRGNRAVTATFARIAVGYFVNSGEAHDAARALIERLLRVVVHTCAAPSHHKALAPFCGSVQKCRSPDASKDILQFSEVECIMKVVQETLGTDWDVSRLRALLNLFGNVFELLGHRVVIWSQPLNKLFTYETSVRNTADAFAIQLIIGAPHTEGDEGNHTSSCGLYVVSPAFLLQTQLEMASHRKRGDAAPVESYSPGAIEGLDKFLRTQVAEVEAAQFDVMGPFEPLKAVIDRLLSHPELEALSASSRSQLRMILGSNPENDDLIVHQKEFLEESSKLSYGVTPLDLEILRNVTMRQAIQVCIDTHARCTEIVDELKKRLIRVLLTARDGAEAAITVGLKRAVRAKLINTIEDVLREIRSISCDDWGCSKIGRAEMSFHSLSGFYSPHSFYKMQAEVFEETMPLTCSAVAPSYGQAVAVTRPTLTLPQWVTILRSFETKVQGDEIGISRSVIPTIHEFVRNCFDVAQHRLLDSLAVIQMTVKRNAPSWTPELQFEYRQREETKQLTIQNALEECCNTKEFFQAGATVSAHRLLKSLRSHGLTVGWKEVLGSLTDNRLSNVTWTQRAINIGVRKMGDNEQAMSRSCQEREFWERGAKACTRIFLRRMRARGLKLGRLSPVSKKSLSDMKQTYEEWLDKARDVLFIATRGGKNTMVIDQYSNAETKVWVRTAEALYTFPDLSWSELRRRIIRSSDGVSLTVLGKEKAKRLYFAVKRLHIAVSYVQEKQFNKFGAFLVTDALLRRLREQNVYEAGNSAITIGHIKRIRTFSEWKRKVLLLKVSTEVIRAPLPGSLIRAMTEHKYLMRLLRWFVKSKAMTNLVRTTLLSVLRLALGPALTRFVQLKSTPKKGDTVQENEGSSAFVSGVVALSILLSNYGVLKMPVTTLLLPPIISFLKSYSTKNLIDSTIDNLNLPRLVVDMMEPFLPQIEQILISVARSVFTVEFLDSLFKQNVSHRFDLQGLAVAGNVSKVAASLTEAMRRFLPHFLASSSKYFMKPTLQYALRSLKEMVVTLVTTGADQIASALLKSPINPHGALMEYIIRDSSLTDAVGLKDLYDAAMSVFREKTVAALNPTVPIDPKIKSGLTPLQQILVFGLFTPTHPLNPLKFSSVTEQSWKIRTAKYNWNFYDSLKTAVTGFQGELHLKLLEHQRETEQIFYVVKVKGTTVAGLKKLKCFRRRKVLFAFQSSTLSHTGEMTLTGHDNQVVGTLVVRFGPLFTSALRQARLIESYNKLIPTSVKHLQTISPESLEDTLAELSRQLPGIDSLDRLRSEAVKIVDRGIYEKLLEYEYFSQPEWFATDFGLSLSVPREDDTVAAGAGAVEITVLAGHEEIPKTYLVSVFEHQSAIAQLDETVKKRCQKATGLMQRLRSAIRFRSSRHYATKCLKAISMSTDRSGQAFLNVTWYGKTGISSVQFQVTPTNNPETAPDILRSAEHYLTDEDLEELKTRLVAASNQKSENYEVVHWAAFTVLFKRALVGASYRRQRRDFGRAMSETSDSDKRVFREQDYLDSEIFKRQTVSTDAGWSLRLDALLGQPKYRPLLEMFGDKLSEYKEALVLALSNIKLGYPDKLLRDDVLVTADRLDELCPPSWPEDPVKREGCEQNNGLWGSLRITDPTSRLLEFTGKTKMTTPALFKYWSTGSLEARAKYAIGELDELEEFLHARHEVGVNIKIVNPHLVSQQVFVQLYNDHLAAEATNQVTDPQEKYQILKYMHISMLRLLREHSAGQSKPEDLSVSSTLRNAGQAVINSLEPDKAMSPQSKYTWFSKLEAYTEQVYRDMEICFDLRKLSRTLRTPTDLPGKGNITSLRYLVFATKMLHQNPFVEGSSFQAALQDPSIRRGCSATPRDCPSPAVLWNHVYITLLVMLQLSHQPALLESLMSAKDFNIRGKGEPAEPISFKQAMSLFQYGLAIIAKWKITPEVQHYFDSSVDLNWIKSFFSLFTEDETFRVLMVYTPPLSLKTTILQNPRAVLQKAVWNALLALYGFRGGFNRFALEIQVGLPKQSGSSVPYGLASSEVDFLQMPFSIRESMVKQLRELLGNTESPSEPLLILERQGLKLLDSTLMGLLPVVRRTGRLQLSHPQFTFFMRNVRSFLHRYRGTPSAKMTGEKLMDTTIRRRFLEIVRTTALQGAFAEQLRLALPVRFLWKRDQFFHIDNLKKISEEFSATGVIPPDLTTRFVSLFPVVCDAIPASSYDSALSILGVDTTPVISFREKAVRLREVLKDAGVEVQASFHHPLDKFVATEGGACKGLGKVLLKQSRIAEACQDVEEARKAVQEKISFLLDFQRKVGEEEAKVAERVNCDPATEEGQMLKDFFVQLMMDELNNWALTNYWTRYLDVRETSFSEPLIEPLDEHVVAGVLHKVALQARSHPQGEISKELEDAVYPTICQFISYVRRATQDTSTADICRVFPEGRPSLLRFLRSGIENQKMRLEVNSFAFTRGSNVLWTDNLGELIRDNEEVNTPQNLVVIVFMRMLYQLFSSAPGDHYRRHQHLEDGLFSRTSRSTSSLKRSVADVMDLIAEKIQQKRKTIRKWNSKLTNSILYFVDVAIRHAMTALKRFTSFSAKQRALAGEEIDSQLDLERRLDAAQSEGLGFYDGPRQPEGEESGGRENVSLINIQSGDTTTAVTTPHAVETPVSSTQSQERNFLVRPQNPPPSFVQISLTSLVHHYAAAFVLKAHRMIPGLLASALTQDTKALADLLRKKATVSGSVKSIAMSSCVNIFDNIILPTLSTPDVLAPEATLRNLIAQVVRGLHHAVTPNLEVVEEKFKRLRSEKGFIPTATFASGIILTAVTELEWVMQDPKWQAEIIRTLQEYMRSMTSAAVDLFKKFRLADAVCQATEPLSDALADLIDRNSDSLWDAVSDIIQYDAFSLLADFGDAHVAREFKILNDTGSFYDLVELLLGSGTMSNVLDIAKGGYYWYRREKL